jgi:hypothetical protein
LLWPRENDFILVLESVKADPAFFRLFRASAGFTLLPLREWLEMDLKAGRLIKLYCFTQARLIRDELLDPTFFLEFLDSQLVFIRLGDAPL